VHEGGFAIQRNGEGAYYFVRPDGRPIDAMYVPGRDRVEEERPVYRVELYSAESTPRPGLLPPKPGRVCCAKSFAPATSRPH
jgi:hypothetical protein